MSGTEPLRLPGKEGMRSTCGLLQVWPAGRCWWVAACRCGWTTPLSGSAEAARNGLRKHMGAPVAPRTLAYGELPADY